jgi:hypothetical protein
MKRSANNPQRIKGTSPECRHVWALINNLADDDPSPVALDEIAEHFVHCAKCSDAEESLDEVLALYRTQDIISLPADLEQRLLDCMCGQDKLGQPTGASSQA